MQGIVITAIICATVIIIFAICANATKKTKCRQCLYDINALIKTFNEAHTEYNPNHGTFGKYECKASVEEINTILVSIETMIGSCWGNKE